MSDPSRAARIRDVLSRAFSPLHFELHDDSAKHAGHPGAAAGGGHFRVVLVSAAFEGRSRLEQHRMVHAALGEMFGREIHALVLDTRAPSEPWPGR